MEKTASGSPITLTVIHVYNDEPLQLTGMNYSLFNAAGVALVDDQPVVGFDASQDSTEVTIAGNHNSTTAKYDVRTVQFKLQTATGTYVVTNLYEIEGDVLKLTPYVDSFMTYAESVLVRRTVSVPMAFYDAMEDADRATALENAYTRLTALKFGNNVGVLADLSPEAMAALDPKLLDALKKAQIVEANALVESNPVKDKIRMGIISETIGESSMFFRQDMGAAGSSIHSGISDDAYPYLAKYLFKDTSNAQIWKLRRS